MARSEPKVCSQKCGNGVVAAFASTTMCSGCCACAGERGRSNAPRHTTCHVCGLEKLFMICPGFKREPPAKWYRVPDRERRHAFAPPLPKVCAGQNTAEER